MIYGEQPPGYGDFGRERGLAALRLLPSVAGFCSQSPTERTAVGWTIERGGLGGGPLPGSFCRGYMGNGVQCGRFQLRCGHFGAGNGHIRGRNGRFRGGNDHFCRASSVGLFGAPMKGQEAASMGCGQMRKKRRVCQAGHTLLRGESVRDCQMLSWGMSDRLCQSVIQTMEHDTEGIT